MLHFHKLTEPRLSIDCVFFFFFFFFPSVSPSHSTNAASRFSRLLDTVLYWRHSFFHSPSSILTETRRSSLVIREQERRDKASVACPPIESQSQVDRIRTGRCRPAAQASRSGKCDNLAQHSPRLYRWPAFDSRSRVLRQVDAYAPVKQAERSRLE